LVAENVLGFSLRTRVRMIALTASTPPALYTAATGLSANSSPVFRMRSSSASVHLELPLAPAMYAACQTSRFR
jgi:hypothetical protein